MGERELISIIVPAYNTEKYVGNCLKSILSQSYTNIEVIVVNDGSTDSTRKIVEEYVENDSRVTLVNTVNQGVSLARKEGITRARGQYIGFVDSDDFIEYDMYQTLLYYIKEYEADIAHCGVQMCFEDGRIHYFYNTGQFKQQDKEIGLIDLLEGKIIEPGLGNKLYKRCLLEKMLIENKMDFEIRQTEDLLMNYILFSYANKSVFIDTCKLHYMVRQGSSSRNGLNLSMIEDPIKVKELILTMAAGNVKNIAERAYISTLINSYNAIMLEGTSKYAENARCIRKMLVENDKFAKKLTRKTRILYHIIKYCPIFYGGLYRVYYKYFLKKRYE